MKHIVKRVIVLTIIITGFCSCRLSKPGGKTASLNDRLQSVLINAGKQYEFLSAQVPDSVFPKTFENGKYVFCKSGDWVSGFYPCTLMLIGSQTGNNKLYELAKQKMKWLEKEQFNTRTHDLGFMMYCSFGNALEYEALDSYKRILINSAGSLASRFSPVVGAIRSWDSKPKEDFLVIIDNMMNLELLFWATRHTGDTSYRNIAISHANTTLKYHFREDYSSFHVVNYNALTGAVKERKTHQGAFDASAWARGQAWGLYGYTVMYRETRDEKYLQAAEHIASFILSQMPENYIPAWDFNAPDANKFYKDASAAAVIAAALLELQQYSPSGAKQYIQVAENILSSLIGEQYLAGYGQNGGFLLKHSVGHLPAKSEIDVPLTYADYYFVEAVLRYLDLNNKR